MREPGSRSHRTAASAENAPLIVHTPALGQTRGIARRAHDKLTRVVGDREQTKKGRTLDSSNARSLIRRQQRGDCFRCSLSRIMEWVRIGHAG
jgi:hypothetical protein